MNHWAVIFKEKIVTDTCELSGNCLMDLPATNNEKGYGMNILIINTGSSSLKYQLFDMDQTKPMVGGVVERIGEAQGIMTHKDFTGSETKETKFEEPIPDHKAAMDKMAGLISLPIDAVGHRVVQGGEAFQSAVSITEEVKKAIEANNSLAPLHNPANLIGIQVAQELFAGKPQVAVFDTNFHQTRQYEADYPASWKRLFHFCHQEWKMPGYHHGNDPPCRCDDGYPYRRY